MNNKIYKPLVDKLFIATLAIVAVLLTVMTVISAMFPISLVVTLPIDFSIFYIIISPLYGYVELREKSVFIKFGFFLKKEIPYSKIKDVKSDRKFYSESMIALKNAVEHVNIRYNKFDVVTVSVVNNEAFVAELKERIK